MFAIDISSSNGIGVIGLRTCYEDGIDVSNILHVWDLASFWLDNEFHHGLDLERRIMSVSCIYKEIMKSEFWVSEVVLDMIMLWVYFMPPLH